MSQPVYFTITPMEEAMCLAVLKQIGPHEIDYNFLCTSLEIPSQAAAEKRWHQLKTKSANAKGAAISFTPADQALYLAIVKQITLGDLNYEVLRNDIGLPTKRAARTRFKNFKSKLKRAMDAGVPAAGVPFRTNLTNTTLTEQALYLAVLKQMIKVGQIDYDIIRIELELSSKHAAQTRWSQIEAKSAEAKYKGVAAPLTPADEALCLAILKQVEVDKVNYAALRAEMGLNSKRMAQLRWAKFIAKLRKRAGAGVPAAWGPVEIPEKQVKQAPRGQALRKLAAPPGPVEVPGEQALCVGVIKQNLPSEIDLKMLRVDLGLRSRAAALSRWSSFKTKIENGTAIPLTPAEQTMCVTVAKQVEHGTVDYPALHAEIGTPRLAAARLRWNRFKRKHRKGKGVVADGRIKITGPYTAPSTPATTKKTARPPVSSGKKRKLETDDEEDWSDMEDKRRKLETDDEEDWSDMEDKDEDEDEDESENEMDAIDRETSTRPTRRAKVTEFPETAIEDYDHDHEELEHQEGEEDEGDAKYFEFSSDGGMKLEHHDEHEHEESEGDAKDFELSGNGGIKLEHHDEHENQEGEEDAEAFKSSSDRGIKLEHHDEHEHEPEPEPEPEDEYPESEGDMKGFKLSSDGYWKRDLTEIRR
ncbi:hypothetical protein LARI1_G000665 [Lachnellula arida]|uniref:Uncharacterized protein n=1 Tax=Lachnellula arida TaxID=1316785 RepID=A0A8T9BN72_9HELO|nr:hypothetical protein LARI1_G000665 [Lachnellula arida]